MKSEKKTSWSLNHALLILFIALKLTNHIDWSWWWVLSPVWIWFCLYMIIEISKAYKEGKLYK